MKTSKYSFIVDLTKAETPGEICDAFIEAKIKAGIPISETELIMTKSHLVDTLLDVLQEMIDDADKHTTYIEDDKLAQKLLKEIEKATTPKKKPWYKRFWRWITFRSNK